MWISIDNNEDLKNLDSSNCWEDTELVEFYGTTLDEKYFPSDVSRSGYTNKNLHLLLNADSSNGSYLEIVLIDCDFYNSSYLENVHFSGRVDGLKRVEIFDYQDNLRMRCSRAIYRWLESDDPIDGNYFKMSDSISTHEI